EDTHHAHFISLSHQFSKLFAQFYAGGPKDNVINIDLNQNHISLSFVDKQSVVYLTSYKLVFSEKGGKGKKDLDCFKSCNRSKGAGVTTDGMGKGAFGIGIVFCTENDHHLRFHHFEQIDHFDQFNYFGQMKTQFQEQLQHHFVQVRRERRSFEKSLFITEVDEDTIYHTPKRGLNGIRIRGRDFMSMRGTKMDDPNITMEEYIRLEEEKAQNVGKCLTGKLLSMGRSDMAPLPLRDQRHPWLRYQVEGYTEDIVHDFEQRLETIFGRQVNRVHILNFKGLTPDMRQDLAERMRMVYTMDDGQELGEARRSMTWRQFILALGFHTAEEMVEDEFGAYWLGSERVIPDNGDLSDY
nr:hypothetical protein [Tanacetum cinerariifolium]